MFCASPALQDQLLLSLQDEKQASCPQKPPDTPSQLLAALWQRQWQFYCFAKLSSIEAEHGKSPFFA